MFDVVAFCYCVGNYVLLCVVVVVVVDCGLLCVNVVAGCLEIDLVRLTVCVMYLFVKLLTLFIICVSYCNAIQ